MNSYTETERRVFPYSTLDKPPHPDGKPWPKCCRSNNDGAESSLCQCFMRRAPGADHTSRHDKSYTEWGPMVALRESNGRFFCIHRDDGGYYRECAGWAAKYTKNGHEKKTSAAVT